MKFSAQNGWQYFIPEKNYQYDVEVNAYAIAADGTTNQGGQSKITVTVTTNDSSSSDPSPVVNLTASNDAPGEMTLYWSGHSNAASYLVYYYRGDVPSSKPRYTADKNQTNGLKFVNLNPGKYTIRVDAVSDSGKVIEGDPRTKTIYVNPDKPRLVNPHIAYGGILLSPPIINENSTNKIYHSQYVYDVKKGLAGGAIVDDVDLMFSNKFDNGDWVKTDEPIVGPVTNNFAASFGKVYAVKVVAKNAGGFMSSAEEKFIFRSFPEPISGQDVKIIPDDSKLNVSWPNPVANGSTVVSYIVVVSDPNNDSINAIPYFTKMVRGNSTIIDNLTNGVNYRVNIFPVSIEGWSFLSALGKAYYYRTPDFNVNSEKTIEKLFKSYIGSPANGSPKGKPEPVLSLKAKANSFYNSADVTVTWSDNHVGTPAIEYVVSYVADAGKTNLGNGINNGDVVKGFSGWKSLGSNITTNSTGSYSVTIPGFNTMSTTNVFRVAGKNELGQGDYVYYVLGTDATSPPSEVTGIQFTNYKASGSTAGFIVSWDKPSSAGTDKQGNSSEVAIAGYTVKWKKAADSDYASGNSATTTSLSNNITGLEPGINYTVMIQAKNEENGKENFNKGASASTWTPKLPGEVTFSSAPYSAWTTEGFNVAWQSADPGKKGGSGATASITYSVKVYKAGSPDTEVTAAAKDSLSTTSASITDLDSGAQYYVKVKAVNTYGSGTEVTETTKTWTSSVPGKVTVTSADGFTTNGFTVNWGAATAGKANDGTGSAAAVTGYKVGYSTTEGGTYNYGADLGANATNKTFTGLSAGTAYYIRVLAVNAIGESEANDTFRVWTGSVPGNVGTVTTSKGSDPKTSIEVSWVASVAGKAGSYDNGVGGGDNATTSYSVEYKLSTDGDYTIFGNQINGLTATITGLTTSQTYNIRVTAKNTHGSSPAATSGSDVTLDSGSSAPGVPGNFNNGTVTVNSVVLSWAAPSDNGKTKTGSEATSVTYKLEYRLTGGTYSEVAVGGSGVNVANAIGSSTTTTVLGLTSGTSYDFRISAKNADSDYGTAVSLTVETASASPTQ